MVRRVTVTSLLLLATLSCSFNLSAEEQVADNKVSGKKALSGSEIKSVVSGDVINLEGVQIRGNKELPSILYIVPWQEVETRRQLHGHEIILHSLRKRRIRPVMPDLLDQGVK